MNNKSTPRTDAVHKDTESCTWETAYVNMREHAREMEGACHELLDALTKLTAWMYRIREEHEALVVEHSPHDFGLIDAQAAISKAVDLSVEMVVATKYLPPVPPVPAGYDHWVYCGSEKPEPGGDNGDDLVYAIGFENQLQWNVSEARILGPRPHYLKAVKNENHENEYPGRA